MTTTKANNCRFFTSIEQSEKLEKFLPQESSDMYYLYWKEDNHLANLDPFVADGTEERDDGLYNYLSSWSLGALLKVIPKHIKDVNVLRIDIGEKDFSIWYDMIGGGGVNTNLPDITMENPVDACVEMIIRLHDLSLL